MVSPILVIGSEKAVLIVLVLSVCQWVVTSQ